MRGSVLGLITIFRLVVAVGGWYVVVVQNIGIARS